MCIRDRIVEPVLQAWERDEVPLEEYPAGSSFGPSGTRAITQAAPDEEWAGAAPGDDPSD